VDKSGMKNGWARGRCVWLALLSVALCACAPLPQRAGIPTQWTPSPNFDPRRPNYVILHHTGSREAAGALRTLTDPARAVSAHYLVARDGRIFQLVDERARAWHAGASWWGGDRDLNSASLGIELDNDGTEPFPPAQIDALLALLTDIASRHAIPAANYLAHGDVAPGRKADPGVAFPWHTLAARGFGLWCDPPYPPSPAEFDATLALQGLGYDVRDVNAAIAAFKRHFAPQDSTPLLNESDLGQLHCLTQRKRQRD
jgi:N-acetylmuramoyl-L-alanine amidase